MASYGPICSHIVPYVPVWSCTVPYGPLWSPMVRYGPLWYHMVPYGPVWSPIVLFCPVWSCMFRFGHELSGMVLYVPLCSPIALYGLWNFKLPYCSIMSCKVSNSRRYWKLCVLVVHSFCSHFLSQLLFPHFYSKCFSWNLLTAFLGIVCLQFTTFDTQLSLSYKPFSHFIQQPNHMGNFIFQASAICLSTVENRIVRGLGKL